MLLPMFPYQSLCGSLFSGLLGEYLEMELLDHMVILFNFHAATVFWKTAKAFPKWIGHFTFLPLMYKHLNLATSLSIQQYLLVIFKIGVKWFTLLIFLLTWKAKQQRSFIGSTATLSSGWNQSQKPQFPPNLPHMGGRNPSIWVIICYLSWYIWERSWTGSWSNTQTQSANMGCLLPKTAA